MYKKLQDDKKYKDMQNIIMNQFTFVFWSYVPTIQRSVLDSTPAVSQKSWPVVRVRYL